MILFWEYIRVSGSIADDSIENDLFCECSSEGWRSPIALTFEPITKIWRAHILQSKPFNISIEKYVRYLNFFRFDKIFSPKKTIYKKERKGNISPQWKWCQPYPGLAPEEVWKNHLWVRRWHCCDENQIVFILNVVDEGLLKWFFGSPYIRSQQACHRALWCDLPETKENILG